MTSNPLEPQLSDGDVPTWTGNTPPMAMEGPAAPNTTDLAAAIAIVEELKAETEATEWLHVAMKRATLAGIQAAIIRLKREAAQLRHG